MDAHPKELEGEAKRLGARWDPANHVWFATTKMGLGHFQKWLPKPSKAPLKVAGKRSAASAHDVTPAGKRSATLPSSTSAAAASTKQQPTS